VRALLLNDSLPLLNDSELTARFRCARGLQLRNRGWGTEHQSRSSTATATARSGLGSALPVSQLEAASEQRYA
jgi:hypothetical protein